MLIGLIGKGQVGAALGALLRDAGHDISFGVREPAGDEQHNGINALSVPDAARGADVVICAVPFGAWPELAKVIAPFADGRIVIDAANPNLSRDGAFAKQALAEDGGAGAVVAGLLPGARLVRTFSTLSADSLRNGAHRGGDRLGLPVAGDNEDACEIAAKLVRDAGFEPVMVGPLSRARDFDSDRPDVFNTDKTAAEVAETLGVAQRVENAS